ncbi:hypothetical protein BC834DRAFT_843309 [Gloeopeniophorella convolvens]|nr:hypothetical protein BC834DRAFT_843309 [Gloeopeniophorella convolvens]
MHPKAVKAIRARIVSVPPKTLHAYVLAQLYNTPEDALPVLAAFFGALTPPPMLHCARCHANYAEEENSNRACHVAHDNESADVEWVGPDRNGEEYETTWGCCGRTVKGEDGDPPKGWCYEGMHTTDRKRARFREDAESDDDMLFSCDELKCRNIPAHPPRASGGARAPPVDDDTGSEGTEDTDIVEIVSDVGSLGNRAKAKGNSKGKDKGKGKSKARVAKPRTPAQQAEGNGESSKTGGVGAPARVTSAPKQHSNTEPRSTGGRARKKTAAVAAHPAASPPPDSEPLPPGGRRPRSVTETDPVEPAPRATRSRGRGGGETANEKTTTDVEGGGRKRRKVASSAT